MKDERQMADPDNKELWEQGECSLFEARIERRKAGAAKRKAERKALKAEEVKMEWEPTNGVWFGILCAQELGFDNRIIEVDCHIYPPHSHSVTHKHNEAIIIILRGAGYSILDGERGARFPVAENRFLVTVDNGREYSFPRSLLEVGDDIGVMKVRTSSQRAAG
jgi:hypothetical protein